MLPSARQQRQKAIQHCRAGVEGKPTSTLSYDQSSTCPGDMKSLSPLVQDVPSLQHSKAALTTWADDYEVEFLTNTAIVWLVCLPAPPCDALLIAMCRSCELLALTEPPRAHMMW
ncbi:hypothetical protein ABBQ38_013497 [Trebouxia sp. C0009 RCD-2024]